MPAYLIPVLVTAAVIVLPILIGSSLARVWRMPDHGWKISLVIFMALAGTSITYFGWPPKLGIDLSGGSKLIYTVEPNKSHEDQTVDMEKLVSAITKRVNPQGVNEVSIRPYGPDEIEIIIPEADNQDDAARIEDKISSAGTLEFRILADSRDPRHDRAISLSKSPSIVEVLGANGQPIAQWIPMSAKATQQFSGNPYMAVRKTDGDQYEILAMLDAQNVNGDYLSAVVPAHDEMGKPSVSFAFGSRGARLFGRLTSDNLPDPTNPDFMRHLGIILDGTLDSAPTIRSAISDRGEISGNFTDQEVRDLVDVLRAGQLPAKLSDKPVLSQVIDATLGPDTIRKGAISMMASVAAVVVFMLIYYRFAGMIACIALTLNVVLTLAVMIMIKAAFTLPGLAGLVLTVGMAVDANVLIYERIREELARGAALRMAIRNGFSRAMTTIIDSNVTTILTAVVLYVIGSAEVKGFAITLFVGLSLSLFTATFCARVMFDIAERQGWIKDLKMMQFVGETHIDFFRLAKPAIALSLLVIGIGFLGVIARGKNLLNIDFTGGTQITMLFKEPQEISAIRKVVDENQEVLPDASVNNVAFRDEQKGLRIEINTSQQNADLVKARLSDLFKGKLATQELVISDIQPITAAVGGNLDTSVGAAPSSAAQPAGETPTAAPEAPASETPASNTPSEPATTPPVNEPAPAATPPQGQSRAENRGQSLAAEMAVYWQARALKHSQLNDESAILAQAETPATESAAATPPTTEAPATETPATEPAAATVPTAQVDLPGALQQNAPAGAEIKSDATSIPLSTAAAGVPVTGSIESVFAGGTSVKLKFSDVTDYDTVRDKLETAFKGTPEDGVRFELFNLEDRNRSSGRSETWELKIAPPRDASLQADQPARVRLVLDNLQSRLASEPWFPAVTAFGGKVAKSTQEQAIYALGASLILIIAYIWIRFDKLIFGIAAVIAVVHDALVTLGALALSYWLAPYLGFMKVDTFKIDLPIVAAFLTLIGYSLNDTIVIFDRIREIRGKSSNLTVGMINLAVNQTLSRTILTSLTVFMTVFILYVWGGQGIHGFAYALFVGVIAGTYSTVYIASPLLIWMYEFGQRRAAAQGNVSLRRQPTGAR